jgi:hypothetical protein
MFCAAAFLRLAGWFDGWRTLQSQIRWALAWSAVHHIGGNTLKATHWRQQIGYNTLDAAHWIITMEATWIIGSSHWRQHGDGKLEGKNNKTDTKN